MNRDCVLVGPSARGTEIFDLQITLSSRARDRGATLPIIDGSSYEMFYTLFGLHIATDPFADPGAPAFDAIRDAVRIRSSALELANFLGTHVPLKMKISRVGERGLPSVGVATFSMAPLAKQLAAASEGFAEATDDTTAPIVYAASHALAAGAQPIRVSVNFTLRKVGEYAPPSSQPVVADVKSASELAAATSAASAPPAPTVTPNVALAAALVTPTALTPTPIPRAAELRQFHVSIDLRAIRCTSEWPSAEGGADEDARYYVKYRFAPFVAKTVRTSPCFAATALSETDVPGGYTKFVLQISAAALSAQLDGAPLTVGVFMAHASARGGELQLGTCELALGDVLRCKGAWRCPFTAQEFGTRDECAAQMRAVDAIDSNQLAPIERREAKRLLAVEARRFDSAPLAAERKSPIAELEIIATVEDFGPCGVGTAAGAPASAVSMLSATIVGGESVALPSSAAAVAEERNAEARHKLREHEAKSQLREEQLDERSSRLKEGETRLRMREKELDRRIEGVLAQRLSEMEAEWSHRKERRERMEARAAAEFAKIEAKLRDTLAEAERRDRTLREMHSDAQRTVSAKIEELALERRRFKEESKLKVELEQQRGQVRVTPVHTILPRCAGSPRFPSICSRVMLTRFLLVPAPGAPPAVLSSLRTPWQDLIERIAQLRKRCTTAEQRSQSAEEKLAVLRVDMRTRPETVDVAHQQVVALESEQLKLHAAVDAERAKTVRMRWCLLFQFVPACSRVEHPQLTSSHFRFRFRFLVCFHFRIRVRRPLIVPTNCNAQLSAENANLRSRQQLQQLAREVQRLRRILQEHKTRDDQRLRLAFVTQEQKCVSRSPSVFSRSSLISLSLSLSHTHTHHTLCRVVLDGDRQRLKQLRRQLTALRTQDENI